MQGTLFVGGKSVARISSIRSMRADRSLRPGSFSVEATATSAVPLELLKHNEVMVDTGSMTFGARVISMTMSEDLKGTTSVTLRLATRVHVPAPRPLTLTSAQLRAWRRGESIFRVARPKRRRLPRVPMRDRMTVQWARPVGEPITLTPKQIREWRRG